MQETFCGWANFAICKHKTFTNKLGSKRLQLRGWYTTTWTYVPPGLEKMCKELFVAEQILRRTPFVEHLVCNPTCAFAHDAYFVHTCDLILQEDFGYMTLSYWKVSLKIIVVLTLLFVTNSSNLISKWSKGRFPEKVAVLLDFVQIASAPPLHQIWTTWTTFF